MSPALRVALAEVKVSAACVFFETVIAKALEVTAAQPPPPAFVAVIEQAPGVMAVTTPAELTIQIDEVADVKVTVPVV